MFAGAAFTDQADIKVDSDAVDTLVSLGVVNGYTDGSFKPNDTVTRAEMAKMIYVLRTGNSDASAYNDDYSTFADIKGHWARGYVKYCQSLGIIAGQSATKFAPDQTVTAQEAAKMLLVTLGYDAQKAGLVGMTWASKTNALADENGLLDDVNTSFTGPCPRQYAAQLIYNAIDAATVVWRDDAYTKYNYNGKENPTIGEKYMSLSKTVGILEDVTKDTDKDTYTLSVDKNAGESTGKGLSTFTKVAKDYSALKYQKVKVLYKDKDNVFGVYSMTDDNTVATSVMDKVKIDNGKLKIDGTKYTLADADKTAVYVDGVYQVNKDINTYVTANAEGKNVGRAASVQAISNNDTNKINILKVTTYETKKVTYVGKDYVNAGAKYEDDKAHFPSDLKKDDYVAVTAGVNTADGNVGVTKLDVVSGKITTTKGATTKDSYKITIDGKTYEMAGVSTDDTKKMPLNDNVAIVVKGDFCLYLDDANAEAKDIGLLTELYKTGNRYEGTLLKADGSKEKITLKKSEAINGKTVDKAVTDKIIEKAEFDGTASDKALLVSYTKSGSEYKLTIMGSDVLDSDGKKTGVETAGYDKFEASKDDKNTVKNKRFVKTTVKAIDDSATVFVRYKTDSFKVITGKELKNWKDTSTFASTVLADNTNGVPYAKVVYVDRGTQNISGGSDVNYAYVYTVEAGSNVDEDKYEVYYAWNGSETVELWSDDGKNVSTGNVIEYSIDGTVETANGAKTEISIDNVYGAGDNNKAWKMAAILGGDYGTDKVGTVYYVYTTGNDTTVKKNAATTDLTVDTDDDAIILFVNTADDGKKDAGTQLSANMDLSDYAPLKGDVYAANAVIYQGANGKNIIVIDTTGELDSGFIKDQVTLPQVIK